MKTLIKNLKNERKTAIYVRESSKAQANEGYNIHAQEEKCKDYIKLMFDEVKNMDDVLIYREKGYSAKTIKRPVLDQLLNKVRKGKIKTIVVQKLDRLARREIGMWELLELFVQYDVRLITIRENIDTSSAVYKMAISLHTLLAEIEQDLISERTSEALQYGAEQGSYVKGGRTPFGTVREKVYKENGSHIITLNQHPTFWAVLKQIYDLSYHGSNCSEIALIINELPEMKENGLHLCENSIENILSNKIYCGIQEHQGKEYKIHFDDCLDYEYWNQVQINRSIHLNKETKHDYKYHGKVHCKCGAICKIDISKKRLKDGTIKYYKYYVCPECGERISETVIYQTVENEIRNFFKENVSKKFHVQQQQKLNKLEQRNNMLYQLYLDDKLALDTYQAELEKAQVTKERIEKNIRRGIKDYEKLSNKERKEFLNENIKSIVVHTKKSIEITYNA
ncbi:MAG: recombinase family protein [Erysipelotrichaceae bacterium]|nr:recombinase family protein [Erysipelotrichaceae bacterium]